MSNDFQGADVRAVVDQVIVPVKTKKPGKRAIDREPVIKVEYPELSKALEAIDRVNAAMIEESDNVSIARYTLLDSVVSAFSNVPAVNHDIWEQHFREEMRKRYNDKSKVSNIKVALIALSNFGAECVGEHKALQTFCREVRPILKEKGLIPKGKGGRPTGHGTDTPETHGEGEGEASNVVALQVNGKQVREAQEMSRKVAAAILANPAGVPHEFTARFAHLLLASTSDIYRAKRAMRALANEFPDDDIGAFGDRPVVTIEHDESDDE